MHSRQKSILFHQNHKFFAYELNFLLQQYSFTNLFIYKTIADFIDVAIYRPTQRGAFKLVHNSYEYYKANTQFRGAQAWRCANFTGVRCKKCLVRAYTKNFGMVDKVNIRGDHNHSPKRNYGPTHIQYM